MEIREFVPYLPGLLLLLNAWQDWKKREIMPYSLCFFLAAGIIANGVWPWHSFMDACGGMAVGAGFFLISWMSHGSVGIGDGLLLCVTGFYLGTEETLILLLGALFLCAVFSAILLISGRAGKKTAVPFVPFLLAVYLWRVVV